MNFADERKKEKDVESRTMKRSLLKRGLRLARAENRRAEPRARGKGKGKGHSAPRKREKR